MMERLVSVEEVRNALARTRLEGRTIGFVPTMGALHEGHLSLVRASKRRTDITVVSIFVNPTQFGPGEDFDAYPRDPESDAAMLEAEDVEFLFVPAVSVMYPSGSVTRVDPGPLADVLCGAARPGHFSGVATVVTKLLNIVRPDIAFFGEKDYQQLKVLQQVARDLDMPTRVVGCPIVREADGLAMSSRNRYLTPEQRSQALALHRGSERRERGRERGRDRHRRARIHHPDGRRGVRCRTRIRRGRGRRDPRIRGDRGSAMPRFGRGACRKRPADR